MLLIMLLQKLIHDVTEAPEIIMTSPCHQLIADVGYVGKDLHDS